MTKRLIVAAAFCMSVAGCDCSGGGTVGISVDSMAGLTTTEAGGTATFKMVLLSKPGSDVTVPISSSNVKEGKVSAASVIFTTENWNAPQTITVTGVDDTLVDGAQSYKIITAPATSTDKNYSGLNADDVSLSNIDDDSPGLTVSPTTGLTTTEGGGTATFTVVLNSQPSSDVSVELTSSLPTEGTVGPALLVFTPANWNAPQVVTVTGIDDSRADGPQTYTILTAPAVSTDLGYSGVDPADVSVTNTDNDTAGATVTPTTGLTTTEAGGAATFTLVLNTQPTANVTIGLSSSAVTEGTVSPAALTFTPLNWNAPQTVTVTGVDDLVADGNQPYKILTAAATSTDTRYAGLDAADVALTNTDNDSPGVTVTPVTGLVTTEGGGTATFSVVLNTQPTASVTIGLTSSNPAEGTVSPASLVFTPANWNAPQTVTVTGVNDAIADGPQVYSVITAAATSADAKYAGVDPADVAVTNTDNDSPGITVSPTTGLVTTESGGSATFTVRLNSQPTASVTIGLTSSKPSEGTLSPASLIFTTANWNAPQTVTVTGVNDSVADGSQSYSAITAPAVSADTGYNGINPSDVALTNTDNDSPGITIVPLSGLVTTESGGSASFTVVLNSQPTANVTIGLTSSNPTEGTLAVSSVVFTSVNWSAPQTVTVTGVNDSVADGNQPYSIVTAVATSADTNYAGINAANVSVTNTDNDSAGITVTPLTGLITTEGGGTASFTVVLNSQPIANVTIGLSSSNVGEGVIPAASASLVFTSANWNAPRTVTVIGVNDAVADGNQPYTILTAPATSADAAYNGINAADVSVTNTDNDSAGITVTPLSGLITTEAGGTASFTVVLNSQPTANVTLGLSSSNTLEGTVSPGALVFTPTNWNAPRTVTVTGVNDLVADGSQPYTIVTAAATSADANYNGLDPADVAVSNTDNDSAGITVTPLAGLVTTEAAGTASFTVVLNSQPTASVTIDLTSSKPTEGTLSTSSLVFTTSNWNAPRTVTVTGVNDQVADGNQPYTIVTAAATSADPAYNGLDAADVAVVNNDNDSAGITVSPTSGLVTSEFGTTATFTVVLNSQPTASVTINLSVSNFEATLSTAALVFTPSNYATPQTVTVKGSDDSIPDGSQPYTVVTAPATTTDTNYSGLDAADVTGINTDNDTPGILVSPVAGLVTTESGGTATFSVNLDSAPTGNVVIALSSSNVSEGIPSVGSLTFTPVNWNAPQVVTVIGVDDAMADGAKAYTIITGAAVSTDANYSGRNASDVAVTNTDNDTPGVTLTPSAGLITTEAGGQATFSVVLNSQPTSNVVIGLSSSETAEGGVSVSSVTFTPANWNAPQSVTVTGADDLIADGPRLYSIITAPATSADVNYTGFNAADVSVTNTDNDTAGITVTPLAGLITTESGGSATFTVRLNSQPTAGVTIGLTSSKPSEGTLSPGSLVFTTANWNAPQTVTVTGVNDAVQDGNQTYLAVTAPATSADGSYNGLDGADVSVSNTDDDSAGITVSKASGLITTEAGGKDTFTVVLNSQPVANVTVALSSSDTAEAAVSPAALVFTSSNWNAPQTVVVTGVDDAVQDGNQSYTILTAAAVSTDTNFNGINAGDVTGSNTDNDSAGITVSPLAGLITTEAGGTATFTVVLNSQPTGNVSIGLSSNDTTEATVAAAPLVFTPANWNAPQTVTVTGADDAVADGNQPFTINTAAATSADTNYNGFNAADVTGSNTDNDSAGFTVTPVTGLVTTEGSGTATFTVVLNSQPTANVTVAVSSSNLNEGTVNASSLTFTPLNWNALQTVTITGVNDAVADGNQLFTVVIAAAVSADGNYSGMDPTDVQASNTDNDSAGITVSPLVGLTTGEDGTFGSFSIVLNSQPTANVTVGLTSSDLTEGTINLSSVTFTPGNWSAPQSVVVTGVDDAVADGAQVFSIITAQATSVDPNYSVINPSDVSVTNIDNDSPGVTLIGGPSITTEGGGQAFFGIQLNSQPTAVVTIALSSSDASEGLVSPSSLTFTPGNWNAPQTVTVTGIDDLIADGPQAYFVVTAPAVSADPGYSGFNGANQPVSNTDNDSAGITVTQPVTAVTTELGGSTTFAIVLNSQPISNVTVPFTSLDTTEGVVSPASVTFTPVNWNAPRTVTVTGVDDLVQDGNKAYSVTTGPATSADPTYAGLTGTAVSLTNTDNDSAGITVTAGVGLTTTEAGGTTTFTVVLNSQPTANVVIALASNDTTEGLPSASLTFTAANWSAPQTVTVTGVDDAVQDGLQTYAILVQPAVSTDGNYNGKDGNDVLVSNIDNDSAGITLVTPNPLVTTEGAGSTDFYYVLNSQPTADVTVILSSNDTTEGLVTPTSLVFTPANWNSPHVVTVTGVDDPLLDGNQVYSVIADPATSTDPNYAGVDPANVSLSNTDNDTAGFTVTPVTGLVTTESGGTASFSIVLNSQPSSNVSVSLASTNLAEGTLSAASLTFTPVNWNAPHIVTLTGVNDPIAVADGNQPYSVITGAATSTDPNYNGLDPSDVTATNFDNDSAGVQVTLITAPQTIEDGTQAKFTLVLSSQPTANVTIALSSSDNGEGIVSPTSLTFTAADWNVAQLVTVTGIDDGIADGNQPYTIVTGAATSTDLNYSGMPVADVALVNIDDDTPGITVAASPPLKTTESGGTATFTIRLNTAPSSNVTIGLSSSNPSEGTVTASLTFSPANWNLPQTVLVTGVDDLVADGTQGYVIITAPAASTDAAYNGMNAIDVAAQNADNE